MKKITFVGALIAAAIVVIWFLMPAPPMTRSEDTVPSSEALVDITVPSSFSAEAQIGETAFEGNCAECHGTNAAGRNGSGPPLIHKIYEPSHHGDEAFQRAVAAGVRGHHWRFGDMPAIEGLTRADVKMIIDYVRELQRANGIE